MQQTAAQSTFQKVGRRIRDTVSSVFFAPAGQESDDHLVEVVRRDPQVAVWFIKLTTAFSIVGSLAAAAACGLFLTNYWGRCGSCSRPLRFWLIGQVLLQMSQIPVRMVLFVSMRKLSPAWTIEACITSLTASPAWKLSKIVSLVLYGWFVLGVVWWMHSSDCKDCPGISMLIASVLLLSAARISVTLIASRDLFAADVQEEAPEPKVAGASQCQIRVLPLVRVVDSCDGNDSCQPCASDDLATCASGENCAVCICDLETDEWVRRLPCRHHFHPTCIDRWLLQNKKCPLCMHPIDEVHTPSHPKND